MRMIEIEPTWPENTKPLFYERIPTKLGVGYWDWYSIVKMRNNTSSDKLEMCGGNIAAISSLSDVSLAYPMTCCCAFWLLNINLNIRHPQHSVNKLWTACSDILWNRRFDSDQARFRSSIANFSHKSNLSVFLETPGVFSNRLSSLLSARLHRVTACLHAINICTWKNILGCWHLRQANSKVYDRKHHLHQNVNQKPRKILVKILVVCLDGVNFIDEDYAR